MIHIKKILCPVDFFAASDKALQYAAGLAEDYGAKIHLLHVVTPLLPVAQDYPLDTVTVLESVEEAATARMKKLVESLERRGVEVTSKVLTGDVHLWLEETITTEKPDLVVMGSHARSGIERLFMGSVSEWLMRHSPVPILVISEKQKITIQRPRRDRRVA
jgi:nucleotide-binding universal stress UspA family protein